jgi:hypothetical protein
MEQMMIEGVNNGNPVTIEKMNLEATEIIAEISNLPEKDKAKRIRLFVLAGLVSCNSLTISPTDPKYRDTLELWARRMPADDALEFAEKFEKLNSAFFQKRGAGRGTMMPRPSETRSVPSSTIPQITLDGSSSTPPSGSSKP